MCLLSFPFPSCRRKKIPLDASFTHLCDSARSERQVEELVRLDPLEANSHGKGFPTVSLRFAYGWVRKSANEQERPRSIDASKEDDVLSSLENGARSWDRPALIIREEGQLRLSSQASLSLSLPFSQTPHFPCRFRFIVFPRPRSYTHLYDDRISIVSCGRSLSTIKLRGQ